MYYRMTIIFIFQLYGVLYIVLATIHIFHLKASFPYVKHILYSYEFASHISDIWLPILVHEVPTGDARTTVRTVVRLDIGEYACSMCCIMRICKNPLSVYQQAELSIFIVCSPFINFWLRTQHVLPSFRLCKYRYRAVRGMCRTSLEPCEHSVLSLQRIKMQEPFFVT